MKFDLWTSLVVAVVLSAVTSKIVYFGFTSNFAAQIFSPKSYAWRFSHDVYQYRILSKYLLYQLDGWLGDSYPQIGAEARLALLTPDASERFYYALYFLNTFFLILTSVMVVLLLDLKSAFT